MTTPTKLLVIAGITINTDEEGRYCLNDLHKAAGEHPKDKPANFLRRDETLELVKVLESEDQAPVNILLGRGKPQGTYVVRELVFAYAMWISPKFHLEVMEAEASPDNYESALGKAIAYWRSGRIIPMTLAVELWAEGYDIGALEAHHLKV